MPRRVFLVAAERLVLPPNKTQRPRTTEMVREVFERALRASGLARREVEGFVGVPALSDLRFLEAHYQATKLGLFEGGAPVTRTVDTCGASPVTALLEARRMIQCESLDVVAVAAADVVGSLTAAEFFERAEKTAGDADDRPESPAIVRGYDRVARRSRFRRDVYRKVVALESFHAASHADSLFARSGRGSSLEELAASPPVTDLISLRECAWRADGAGCLLLVSEEFLSSSSRPPPSCKACEVTGGGEASGPLCPAEDVSEEQLGGTRRAMTKAYREAGLAGARDVDFFGLYDCFPICLLRAIEAAGLADDAARYVEDQYDALLCGDTDRKTFFPVNTHGGLLAYGAPFAVPAFYAIVEAHRQLAGNAAGRRIPDCRNALVYGNGGVFSSSAAAILSSTTPASSSS